MSVNAACAGYRPVPEFDSGDSQKPLRIEGTPLTRLWRSRPVRGPFGPLAADSLNLYLGGSDRRVAAVDLASGRSRWTVRLPGPPVGGVLLSGGVVYAATDQPGGRVHALRVESGAQLWSTNTGYVEAPIALAGSRLIVLNRRGQVLALEAATGRVAWRHRLPSTHVPPVPLAGGHVLVTSYDSLYLVRVTDGKVTLRRRAPGTVVSPWIQTGDALVAGTGDSLVIAVRPDSLRETWRVRLDAPILVSPTTRGDTLFCVTRIGTVFRVEPGDIPTVARLRDQPWPATGTPALIQGWVLAGGSDGILRAFSLEDGMQVWQVALSRPSEIAPFLLPDGSFLTLGGKGELQRMRP